MSRFWNQLREGLLAFEAMTELDRIRRGDTSESKGLRRLAEILREDLPADGIEATCHNMPTGVTMFHAHWMEDHEGKPLRGMTHNDVRSRILELAQNLDAVANGDPAGDWQLAKNYFLHLHRTAVARSMFRLGLAA